MFATRPIPKHMMTGRTPPAASAASAAVLVLLVAVATASASVQAVTCREVDETIPTYLPGPPSPDPMFSFGDPSHGTDEPVYPYPLYDSLTNLKEDQTYHLIYLENQFIKIAIAPQIGGRVLSAQDKTNGYHFVYNQHVIKPALVGLLGASVSGGIEWNLPQGRRASAFIPVQHLERRNSDGSWTVWVGELEIRRRMCWAVGYTLRPGSSVLECSVRIFNRTPLAQPMLCFANVDVHADRDYQVIFPPSTRFIVRPPGREITPWPIAAGPSAGADLGNGDASWYRNHLSASSMSAWDGQDDFFAGYDHGKQAGTVIVADHDTIPGKKAFTWGTGPHGRMWESILTDNDGPYMELTASTRSDGEPEPPSLQPYEARSFELSWYPIRDIGGVKKANLDAAVNLEVRDGVARFGFYSTAVRSNLRAVLTVAGRALSEDTISIGPDMTYRKQIPLPVGTDEHDVRAALYYNDRELVSYSPIGPSTSPKPVPEKPSTPADSATGDELDQAGQRTMQFQDPLLEARSRWEDTLLRDPADVAANVGLGQAALQLAQYREAEAFFRAALASAGTLDASAKASESRYYLGVALKAQGRQDEAYEAFDKAEASLEWRTPACFSLAEIACARGDFGAALAQVDRSIIAGSPGLRALGLKAAILRHLGRASDARALLASCSLQVDPLDVRLLAEDWLAGDATAEDSLKDTLRAFPNSGLEVVSEYLEAGLWPDGSEFLRLMAGSTPDKGDGQPLLLYYLGDFAERQGDTETAEKWRRAAASCPPDGVFPFQSELIAVLRRAIAANPRDARAPYYLGNLLFNWQPAEATTLWERSAYLDPSFPVVWRNLALSYSHSAGEASQSKAIECLEKSVALSDGYPEHFLELDALYAARGLPVARRLALLESHQSALTNDDECVARLISLRTIAGKNDEAIELLQSHTFNIWEDGTGFDTGRMWTDALLARGRSNLSARNARGALTDFEVALIFPSNLRAAPRESSASRSIEVGYWVGLAHQALGDTTRAVRSWREAASAPLPLEQSGASSQAEREVQRYYQALALSKLGEAGKAEEIFKEVAESGERMAKPQISADSLPPESANAFRTAAADADYVMGLGCLGLGRLAAAHDEFQAALDQCPDYLAAKLALGDASH